MRRTKLDARRGVMYTSFARLHKIAECARMRGARMHRTGGPHTHTPSGLKAKLVTHIDAQPDGLDGRGRVPMSHPHVPLHVIQVFIRLLSVPFLFNRVISQLDA